MTQPPKQRSTERHGVGQSGHAAGREGDPALDRNVEHRNPGHPKGQDEPHDVGDDDRWTGRGGRATKDE
jgi:hypothetical protein